MCLAFIRLGLHYLLDLHNLLLYLNVLVKEKDKNASTAEKLEKTEEKKVEEPEKKGEKNEDKTDGTKDEDNEKRKLDANGEVIKICNVRKIYEIRKKIAEASKQHHLKTPLQEIIDNN